jgi:carotenoid cleavage dioxygenase-like enzyme
MLASATADTRFRRDLPREHGFVPLAVEGTMPPDLTGTLYRNGPGIFELFGLAVYDACTVGAGPIARCWFAHHVPITFHGTWGADSP